MRLANDPMAASNSPRRTSLRSTTSKPLAFKASRTTAEEAVQRGSGGRSAYCALETMRAVRSGSDCAELVVQQSQVADFLRRQCEFTHSPADTSALM